MAKQLLVSDGSDPGSKLSLSLVTLHSLPARPPTGVPVMGWENKEQHDGRIFNEAHPR